MLQVSSKSGNVSDLINESIGSYGEIISNGKINGIYTLRKLIAQEYYFFLDEDVNYNGKKRTIKKIHGNSDIDDVSFDAYDAWVLSALVKDYIESMDEIDELRVPKKSLGKSVKKLLNNRNLTGLSLIDLFQQKYLTFISITPSMEKVFKERKIEGDILLVGINPILMGEIPNIEDIVTKLILESYNYSNTNSDNVKVVCIPISMLSGSSKKTAKKVLENAFKDKEERETLPSKVKQTKTKESLKELAKRCEELYYNEGAVECYKKIKELEKIEEKRTTLEKKTRDVNDYEGLLEHYEELKTFYEEIGDTKATKKADQAIIDAKDVEAKFQSLNEDDVEELKEIIELYSTLDNCEFYLKRIKECNNKIDNVRVNCLDKIEEKTAIKIKGIDEELSNTEKRISELEFELNELGMFKFGRKDEIRTELSQLESEKEEILGKRTYYNNQKSLASALLGDELYKKVSLGNDHGQILEWKVVGNDSKYVVLYGCYVFEKPFKGDMSEGDFKERLFNKDEQSFIESTFESVNVFKSSKEYKHIVIGADANNHVYKLQATENLKTKVKNLRKMQLEQAVEKEFNDRMRRRGSYVSSKAITSQPLVSMIRKEKAHYYSNTTIISTADNCPVIVVDRDAFMESNYCRFLMSSK